MSFEIILRYLHFISVFTIVGSLTAEFVLLKPILPRKEIKRLSTIDAIYGIAALTLLIVGLTLWLSGFGKPAVYYSKNWIFLFKISLFALIGLLSIYPTVFFLRYRKGNPDDSVSVPRVIFWLLRLELFLLLIIPLLAALMSRGVGFFG